MVIVAREAEANGLRLACFDLIQISKGFPPDFKDGFRISKSGFWGQLNKAIALSLYTCENRM